MDEKYLPIIKDVAKTVRKQHGLNESTVIGDYIFSILQNDCILLQWSEENQQDLDGFSTVKYIGGEEKNVVYINTAKNTEKQNFCAAHELGHQSGLERLLRDEFYEDILTQNQVENIMNRFAAELMMPETDFKKQSKAYIKKYSEKGHYLSVRAAICIVIHLMDFYYMPYKAVVYRLRELHIFSANSCNILEEFERDHKEAVDKQIDLMGITRLRSTANKHQVSEPVSDIAKCLKDPKITKYLSNSERIKYCEELGIDTSEEESLKELKNMEKENIIT